MAQRPGLTESREDLAQFANGLLTPAQRVEHSRLVARYVAAAIRDDREHRTPLAAPSLFDRVFGKFPL